MSEILEIGALLIIAVSLSLVALARYMKNSLDIQRELQSDIDCLRDEKGKSEQECDKKIAELRKQIIYFEQSSERQRAKIAKLELLSKRDDGIVRYLMENKKYDTRALKAYQLFSFLLGFIIVIKQVIDLNIKR